MRLHPLSVFFFFFFNFVIEGDGLYEGLDWLSKHLPKTPHHAPKKKIEARALVVGFDGAGKTTFLYHTKDELTGGLAAFVSEKITRRRSRPRNRQMVSMSKH